MPSDEDIAAASRRSKALPALQEYHIFPRITSEQRPWFQERNTIWRPKKCNWLAYGLEDAYAEQLDIYKMDADGKAIEHWDVLQVVGDPKNSAPWLAPNVPCANPNGMF